MGQNRLTIAFGPWVADRFSPEIEGYSRILLERIDRIFEDVDGEGRRAMDEFIGTMSDRVHDEDYELVAEAAYGHAQSVALQFFEMRAVFLATGVSGLFHLFERQFYYHLNKELTGWLTEPVNQWRDLEVLIPRFDQKSPQGAPCSDLVDAFSDADLQELRLVANTVKHGAGRSYQQLVDNNAIVVSHERLKGDYATGPHTVLGVDISVRREDVERYRDSILRLWRLDGTFWADRSAFK